MLKEAVTGIAVPTLWADTNAVDRGFEKLTAQERQHLAEFAAP
jgi:hypothetical protein